MQFMKYEVLISPHQGDANRIIMLPSQNETHSDAMSYTFSKQNTDSLKINFSLFNTIYQIHNAGSKVSIFENLKHEF